MTGPGFAFEVRPQLLAGYAETLHARAGDLAAVGAAVAAVRVEREWFGRLPAAGLLAERYAAHRDAELAEVGALAAWLAEAGAGLTDSAGRYSAADRVVAGVADAVAAGLGVGIEIPGTAAISGDAADRGAAAESGGGAESSDGALG